MTVSTPSPALRLNVPVGGNVDTVVGVIDSLISSPVCALLVAANAYARDALGSVWVGAYAALFAARAGAAWVQRRRRAARAPVEWAKHVVLLTGGSHGIGLSLARRLAQTGARVAVLDIAAMPAPVPAGVTEFRCDLSDGAAVERAVAAVERDLGAITMLINNAGTVCPRLVSEQSAADVERVARVNFVAPMQLTRRVLPGMLAPGCGHAHIVFVSSVLAYMGVPQLATYTATKAGVALFHESLSLELRHRLGASHVHTTAVFPSKVSSGMFDGLDLPQWLSPDLSPDLIADSIFAALDSAHDGEIYLPFFANSGPLYMLLPRFGRNHLHWVSGSLHSMKAFRGRTHVADE
ncbi:hypothetical protein H4R26_001227 [Coemansia thaxteri]|uniref:Ketoreductase domain-containing protein n=1 Tax=Coemansia thaxteri TaxID=2663907 RepID=A0A9W8BMA9_9FUNG|nr:hypothetical protein H4R26_001227 [Coemansia thaxteri]